MDVLTGSHAVYLLCEFCPAPPFISYLFNVFSYLIFVLFLVFAWIFVFALTHQGVFLVFFFFLLYSMLKCSINLD